MSATLAPDVASFSNQQFIGVSGAHRMLMRISSDVRRLDAGHNALGRDGALALFDGLTHARRRYSSVERPTIASSRARNSERATKHKIEETPELNAQAEEEERYRGRSRAPRSAAPSVPRAARKHEPRPIEEWGMSEINLARNSVGNDGLLAATSYVSRDEAMRELLLPENNITLEGIVDTVVERLNTSRLTELSLSSNPLNADAVIRLFETLNAPNLRELHLSACNLPAECVPAICDFIRSPRSQNLWLLQLNGNALGRLGVTSILDALEDGNFSISRIGLFANNTRGPMREASPSPARPVFGGESDYDSVWESDDKMDPADPKSMKNQIQSRVPALQKRNAELTKRVRRAAARAISPTRIILHARPPTAVEAATSSMQTAGVTEQEPQQQPFRLLDLPAEVRILIARHCSRDADALTDAQWTRVRMHADDRASLGTMAVRMKEAENTVRPGAHAAPVRKYKAIETREAWLGDVGCGRWDLEDKRYWDKLEAQPEIRA